ncbi:MAG: DMT family transporter [Streptosporangiales bacterium]
MATSTTTSTSAATDAAFAAAFVVMWSSGFVGSELGTQVAPATTLLAWRFPIAAGLLLLWRFHRRGPRPRIRDIAFQSVIGLLAQGGYLLGVVLAVQLGVPAGTTALVASMQPIVSGVLALPVLGERVRLGQWLGLATGFGGVTLVVGGNLALTAAVSWWAYALPFGAMASLVAATLLERKVGSNVTMVDSLAIQCATSVLLFGALAAATGTLRPVGGAQFWIAVAWMVGLSTFGGYGFYWATLRRSGIARLSSLLYLTPATTALWTSLMFGEEAGVWALAGMAISGVSVLLVYRPARLSTNVRSPLAHLALRSEDEASCEGDGCERRLQSRCSC